MKKQKDKLFYEIICREYLILKKKKSKTELFSVLLLYYFLLEKR
jgi:hypothetical protein